MPKKKQNIRTILSFVFIGMVFVCIVSVYVWYNYLYNPVVYQGKSYDALYDTGYYVCLDTDLASDKMMILKEYYCKCVAEKMADAEHDKVVRRKVSMKNMEHAYVSCKDETKFSTVSDKELMNLFLKRCKKGFGAHQTKFCECVAAATVLWMRKYSYESAIDLHLKDVVNKANEMCISHYMKANKL